MKYPVVTLAVVVASALPMGVFAQAKPTNVYVSVVDAKAIRR